MNGSNPQAPSVDASVDRLEHYDYALPPELIAQYPLPVRSASRLLHLLRRNGECADRSMPELPELLRPDDLLVFNDTRVVPARVMGNKSSGGRVEIFLERILTEHSSRALVQMRASKPCRAGQIIDTAGGAVRIIAVHDRLWEVATPGDALDFFEQHGAVPLPPYIGRAANLDDRERYQSVFARVPGAVAAPTASLHFDDALLAALARRGVRRATLTLHVGAGTFQPVRVSNLAEHRMHAETFAVESALVEAVERTRALGGRVIAVGTTVARALESAANAAGGPLCSTRGETQLFIRPGYTFRMIDALLTNFHLPRSTLLMLVSAFTGREAVLRAYAHAVAQRYRFFSYGDAMLIA